MCRGAGRYVRVGEQGGMYVQGSREVCMCRGAGRYVCVGEQGGMYV